MTIMEKLVCRVVAILIVMGLIGCAWAGGIPKPWPVPLNLIWDAPTNYDIDYSAGIGSIAIPTNAVITYKVYSLLGTNWVMTDVGLATNATIMVVPSKPCYYVTATVNGGESDGSEVVAKTVPPKMKK